MLDIWRMGDGSEVYRAVLGPIWEQWHQYDCIFGGTWSKRQRQKQLQFWNNMSEG